MEIHQVGQRPLPGRRFGKAKSAEGGRAMCCRLIGRQCGICRDGAMGRWGDDADLRDAIKRVSRERRRFGCRRIHVMIAREGFAVTHKKVRRIYTEETLQVRRRVGRKRALGRRKPMVLPDGPNQRWSLDFVSASLTTSRDIAA
jgi:hypothetical protein